MLLARRIAAVAAALALTFSGTTFAQTIPPQHAANSPEMNEMMQLHHAQGQMAMAGHHSRDQAETAILTSPGQDAFGAIQEIVHVLDADPRIDWSKVDLDALRQHLIDMNAVTLKAKAAPKPIDGGLEIAITGNGRTLVAIQRMIPASVQMANGLNGWTAKAASLPNGELLTVTAADPKEVRHIRGLGFIGLLVSGPWHQMHHLAMAKGEFVHAH